MYEVCLICVYFGIHTQPGPPRAIVSRIVAIELVTPFVPAIRTEKSFKNLIKSTRYQIVFTIFRLIWIQTDVRLDPTQLENDKCSLMSG